MRPHSSRIEPTGYVDLNPQGRVPIGPKGPHDMICEQGDYDPNYDVGISKPD